MEKKPTTARRNPLGLSTETLRRLDDSKLGRADGGVRMWRPVGFAADSTPIYEEVEE